MGERLRSLQEDIVIPRWIAYLGTTLLIPILIWLSIGHIQDDENHRRMAELSAEVKVLHDLLAEHRSAADLHHARAAKIDQKLLIIDRDIDRLDAQLRSLLPRVRP